MSRDSAIIKFGYENHKEYEDHAAGNRKHSAKCMFCTGATLLIGREQHRLLRGICVANTKPSKIFNICKKVLLNALSLVDVFEHFD